MTSDSLFHVSFRCAAGCPGDLNVEEPRYLCETCGGLLEVWHNSEKLKTRSSSEWKDVFRKRAGSFENPNESGVWRKKEWVAPHIRQENIVSLGEGGTHLQVLPRGGDAFGCGKLWLKQCGISHSGSFKDLGMTVLVSAVNQMVKDGAQIPAMICASTGDTSAALAAYAAAAGLPAVVLLPAGKVSPEQLVQPLACGATVLAVDGDFDHCMELVRGLVENEGLYLANSMNALRVEGQKTVAFEIAEQLGWESPDWIVIPGGNLGNVSALGAGWRMMMELGLVSKTPRICVAQAEPANPLYRSFQKRFEEFSPMKAGETLATAIRIGNPVSREKAIRVLTEYNGVVEQANDSELSEASTLADRMGMYTCPHTGVALASVKKLTARGVIGADDRVVAVSTANGLKFNQFKADQNKPTHTKMANQPHKVSARYEDVRDIILQLAF